MNWPVLPNANASPLASLESVLAGAWDADLLSEVTTLLQPYEATAATTSDDEEDDEEDDDEDDDDEDDRINDSDLAILNQLLATQSDAVHYQQQHQSIAPATAPAQPAPSTTKTTDRKAAKKERKEQPPSGSATVVDEEVQFTGRTTRERRKEELVYLRAKAVELEAKLKQHKDRRLQESERDQQQQDDSQQQQLSRSGPSRYAALWMKLAKRQEEERRLAQAENAKLRQLVVAQVRLARSLDRVLRKRMRQKTPGLISDGGDSTLLGDDHEATRSTR